MTIVQQNPDALMDDSQNPANDDSDKEEQNVGAATTYEEDCIVEDPFFTIEKITDWNKRIANYPEDVKKNYQRMFGVVDELKKICYSSNDTWNN